MYSRLTQATLDTILMTRLTANCTRILRESGYFQSQGGWNIGFSTKLRLSIFLSPCPGHDIFKGRRIGTKDLKKFFQLSHLSPCPGRRNQTKHRYSPKNNYTMK